jgi:glycine/D-amino acid oxidase-like deaminating enzyme
VIAAVEAARRGLNVVLIEPSGHLGGMTSGGLRYRLRGIKAILREADTA